MKPILNPGDIFCTRNPMALGRIINGMQKFWSPDNQSEYSHSGIILDSKENTFESLWTIKRSNLNTYISKKILIGRHINMNSKLFQIGFDKIKHHEGQWYPMHRLPLFIIPPLAKYIATGYFPVCSELAAKFLYRCYLLEENWKGKNPDHIADMIIKWKVFEVIFEGEWT